MCASVTNNQFVNKPTNYLILFFSLLITNLAMAENECFPVQGKFKSQTLPPSECTSPVAFCTRGVLSGGLWGDYDFIAQQFIPANEATVPLANFYTGFSRVYTRRGELHLTDTGALNLATGQVSSLLTVTGGSGDFVDATGHLFIYGVSNSVTSLNSGKYRGEVCIDD